MIDIGEDLVGAYLSRIKGCSVVQFNVRTGVEQAEIDIVGLTSWVIGFQDCCREVSTHTGGLGGYGGDVAGKIGKKIASVRRYADTTFPMCLASRAGAVGGCASHGLHVRWALAVGHQVRGETVIAAHQQHPVRVCSGWS